MAHFAGKSGYVKQDTVVQSFGEWSMDAETDPVIIATFDDSGFDTNLEGRSRATISIAGPFRSGTGGMSIRSGQLYTFVLGMGTGDLGQAVEFSVSARVHKVTPKTKTDSKEPASLTIAATVSGSFPTIS